jgi:putative AdoMet-dependent methyltransferase
MPDFLTYEHLDESAAAIAMTLALHHLPDLWKGIALARMRTILKLDGQLYIHDVILEQDNATEAIQAFINKQSVCRRRLSQERCRRPFSGRAFNL